jgi:acyl carrier protein
MTRDTLKKIIQDLFGTPVEDLTDTTTLSELGTDSLLFLEFILMCEDEFDLDLGSYEDQITGPSTLAEIENYIESEKAKRS